MPPGNGCNAMFLTGQTPLCMGLPVKSARFAFNSPLRVSPVSTQRTAGQAKKRRYKNRGYWPQTAKENRGKRQKAKEPCYGQNGYTTETLSEPGLADEQRVQPTKRHR